MQLCAFTHTSKGVHVQNKMSLSIKKQTKSKRMFSKQPMACPHWETQSDGLSQSSYLVQIIYIPLCWVGNRNALRSIAEMQFLHLSVTNALRWNVGWLFPRILLTGLSGLYDYICLLKHFGTMSKIAIPYLTILDNKKAIFFTSLKIPRFIFFFIKK